MDALDALFTVLPVLLLFALGAALARSGILGPATAADLRRLVLTVTLPSALFLAFLRVPFEPAMLLIVVPVFAACVAALAAGPWVSRTIGAGSPFAPGLLAGFEAGMLGYAMYASAFGTAELHRFAIVDIGQVVFVFFVLAPWLERRSTGTSTPRSATLRAFVRTPVIVAIALGIACGLAGLAGPLEAFPPTRAALEGLGLLGAMTTPLIALVIGSTTRLRPGALGQPARVVLVRLAGWTAAGLAFNAVVIRGVLNLDALYEAAIMTMAILPPPFVIPLYLRGDRVPQGTHDEIANALTIATLATLVAFTLVVGAFGS